jgi:HipA-like kinase
MMRRLIAAQFHRLMDTGRTSPLLCGCEDSAERHIGDLVVKLRGNLDRRESGLLSEMVGSQVAAHFGILVPEPSIVEINRSFAELVAAELVAMRRPEIADGILSSIGLNFGSRLLTGVATWPVDKQIPEAMLGSAADLFAFDALVQNSDRSYDNPNVFTRGDSMYAYDHEMAFSFLLDIRPSPTPWILDREAYLDRHVFFTRLKGKQIDLANFAERLKFLTDAVLAAVRASVPESWANPDWLRIEAHLRVVRQHADEFVESVQRRLA